MTLSPRPPEQLAPLVPPRLPIGSRELLATGLSQGRLLELELAHGNADLMRALDILGIAGPFEVLSPWELQDPQGRHLVSAGGYAALPFGDHYPPLVRFVQEFLAESRHMGLPQQSLSPWRAALETNLVSVLATLAPSHGDSRVFFSNSGAEAIETAVKFVKAARPGARWLVNFSNAYHGKTTAALSLTPNPAYQALFRPLMPNVKTLPYGDLEALEKAVLNLGPGNIVALFVEPIQGEGGVVSPPPEFLPGLAALARRHEILVVADEIQTGLGRSGHWFASLAGGLEPDLITLAKPLGGGLVPVGATIARRDIYRRALGGVEAKRHSNTFGGGSLAMAVGLRSLELIVEEDLVAKAQRDGEHGLARLREIQARYPGFIKEVRGAGMLFAIQLRHVLKPFLAFGQHETVRQIGTGLAVRSLHLHGVHACFSVNASRTLRLTPALNMPRDLFDEMFDRIERTARHNRRAWQLVPGTPALRLLRLARLALDT